MAGFCIYCGKPLENGTCTCSDFQAARQAAAQQAAAQQAAAQQMAARQQVWQGNAQGNGQPDMRAGGNGQDAYSQTIKTQFSSSKGMFFDFIKNPITMMKKVYTGADKKTAILMGVFHLLIFLVICLVKIPVLEFEDKMGIGLKVAVAVGAFVVLHALITFGIAKYRHVPVDIMSVIGIFCVATIPSSAFLIVALVASYVSWTILGLCLIMGLLAWIVLATEAVKVALHEDKDIVFWLIMLVMALVVIITAIVAKQIVMGIVKQLALSAITNSAGDFLNDALGSFLF